MEKIFIRDLTTKQIRELTPDEYTEHEARDAEWEAGSIDRMWSEVRSKRDALLVACDWTMVPDAPTDKVAWTAYRQELRDLPETQTDPFNIVWPEKPEQIMDKFNHHLETVMPVAVIAALFGILRAIAAPHPKSWKSMVAGVVIAVPVGTLAGMLALESGFKTYAALTITSIVALLGRDLVEGIMDNRGFLVDLIKRGLTNITDKVTK